MITQDKKAYTEVYTILSKLNLFSELPNNIKNEIIYQKNNDYYFDINVNIPLNEQVQNQNTLDIISYLYVKYLCKDENEKRFLKSKYESNEIKYQNEIKEKYNLENIFTNKKQNKTIESDLSKNQELSMVDYKESILRRILNKIKNIFRR